MKKTMKSYILTAVGLVLLGSGLLMIKTVASPQGILERLPYIFVGIGCGVFGQGMGEVIRSKAVKGHPEIEKQLEIEKNDERNIAISNTAKARAFDMMIFVFGALMLSFALMNIDLAATLLLVFAYLFVVGYSIFYRCKLDKEM